MKIYLLFLILFSAIGCSLDGKQTMEYEFRCDLTKSEFESNKSFLIEDETSRENGAVIEINAYSLNKEYYFILFFSQAGNLKAANKQRIKRFLFGQWTEQNVVLENCGNNA